MTESLWWCTDCGMFIAAEQVKERDGLMRHYKHETSFDDTIPTHLLHVVMPREIPDDAPPPAAAEPSEADKAAEAAHDALMARLIEAVYIMGVSCTKLAGLPAQFIPRVLVCAAVRGIEKSLENFLRVSEPDNPRGASRQQIAALQVRLNDDMTELQAALTEATESLATLRAELTVPQSNLIS
jgi:hypothetical protein